MAKIIVDKTEISVINVRGEDYMSLTDMAKFKSDEPAAVIGNWIRNRNTIEYLGLWEFLYNPFFKPLEFEEFRKQAGLNAFTLSPQKWINATSASGIVCKSGRYGELTPTKTLRSNSRDDCLWSLNYTWQRNSNV